MEHLLICVEPNAPVDIYEFFEGNFRDPGWEPYVIPVTDVKLADLRDIAAVIAIASNWPQENIHAWLADIRTTVGPNKRVLAILPRPPCDYPDATRAMWDQALGYGYKINAVIAIIRDFVAGRR